MRRMMQSGIGAKTATEQRNPTRNRESKMHRSLYGSSAMPRNALHRFGYGIVTHRQVGYVTVTFLR